METNNKNGVVTRVVNAPAEKPEAKKLQIVKPVEVEKRVMAQHKPNLQETMRIIDELHQKTRHRNKLEFYSDVLAKFSIEQKQEDLLAKNFYSGCSLIITDDKRENFELRHPVLISEVVSFLQNRFSDKLSEIEAEIILP